MSSKPLLLEGVVREASAREHEEALFRVRKEKQQIEEELLHVRRELDDMTREKERIERSIRALRSQLSPLHRALRALFGEIEIAVGEEERVVASQAPSESVSQDPRWQSYKQEFPGVPARIVDALLTHKEMTITQLSGFLRVHYDTVKGALQRLTMAGAVTKDGGKGGKVRLNQ